jgi:hypothetical protein
VPVQTVMNTVQTIMNNSAALFFGEVQVRRRRGIARCHALFKRLDLNQRLSHQSIELTDKISALSFNSTLPSTREPSSRVVVKVCDFDGCFCTPNALAGCLGPIQFQNVAFAGRSSGHRPNANRMSSAAAPDAKG